MVTRDDTCDALLHNLPMKMIIEKLSKTASPPVTCHRDESPEDQEG